MALEQRSRKQIVPMPLAKDGTYLPAFRCAPLFTFSPLPKLDTLLTTPGASSSCLSGGVSPCFAQYAENLPPWLP